MKGDTGDKEENHTGKYVAQTHMYSQTKLDAASPWDKLNVRMCYSTQFEPNLLILDSSRLKKSVLVAQHSHRQSLDLFYSRDFVELFSGYTYGELTLTAGQTQDLSQCGCLPCKTKNFKELLQILLFAIAVLKKYLAFLKEIHFVHQLSCQRIIIRSVLFIDQFYFEPFWP